MRFNYADYLEEESSSYLMGPAKLTVAELEDPAVMANVEAAMTEASSKMNRPRGVLRCRDGQDR